jgi:hypothetical protein
MASSVNRCDVRSKLEAILSEQITRLLKSGMIQNHHVLEAMTVLRSKRLLPDQIESDICKELKKISLLRYDIAMPSSQRANGFGWSLEHMKSHMQKMLKCKIEEVSTILRVVSSEASKVTKSQ